MKNDKYQKFAVIPL